MFKGFWWRLVNLNPALFRAVVISVFALLASLGIVVNDALPDQLVGVVVAVLALVQGLWTKAAVTPNEKVLAYVPDPVDKPQEVAAGAATTTAPDTVILDAVANTDGTYGVDPYPRSRW